MAGFYARHVLPRVLCWACAAPSIAERRRRIVPWAEGRVLEIGAGGGLNLPFYEPGRVTEVVGVDPSAELRGRAERARRPSGLAVRLAPGVAEDLPFEDGAFDTAVCTFTLRSVRSPLQALSEVRRVLRPGGRLLFAEHGLAPDAGTARWQRRLEPVWTRLAGGCRLTRAPAATLAEAGFEVGGLDSGYMAGAPRFAGWCETGWAVPR